MKRLWFINYNLVLRSLVAVAAALAISACEQPAEEEEGGATDEAPPVITTPQWTSVSPASPSNSNSISLYGRAAPLLEIQIHRNSSCSNLVGTTASGATGNFVFNTAVAADATHTFYARAVLEDGSFTSCSSAITYVEDSTAPSEPSGLAISPVGPANFNSPQVSGSAESASTVLVYSDDSCTTLVTSSVVPSNGSFSFPVTVADNSVNSLYLRARDAAGNSSACSDNYLSYTEDSQPPATPSSLAINPTSPANNNNPILTGTTEANALVNLYLNSSCSGAIVNSGGVDGSGNFSIIISITDNTTRTYYARAYDAAGNPSPCTTTGLTYIEDSIASPPLGLATTPVSPANNNSPSVSGTAEANSTVTLFSNSNCTTSVASGSVNSLGQFSVPVSVTDNTTTTFYGRITDQAGNSSTCSVSYVTYAEDSAAPAVPSTLATNPTSPANNNSPSVSGSTEIGAGVSLYLDSGCAGSVVGSGTANGSGLFNISVSVSDNSTSTFYARATDSVGNASACSSGVTFVEDSLAPEVPITLASSPVSPAANNSPNITGLTEANANVNIFADSSCSGSVAGTGVANGSGNFSVSVTVGDDSTTSFYARASDAAGNLSACSSSFVEYIEVSTVPATPSSLAFNPASPANNNSPQLSAISGAGATINIFTTSDCSGTVVGSGSTNGSGAFNITLSVSDNTSTTFYARGSNIAGNGGCSAGITYIEDSQAPAVPSTLATNPTSPSNSNSVSITGVSEAGATVFLYSDSSCAGTVIGSQAADGSGNFSISTSVSDNSNNLFYVRARDLANNQSACSSAINYLEDSIPPSMPVVASVAPSLPSDNNTPTVSGTGDANTPVYFYLDSSCTTTVGSGSTNSSGDFSFATSSLPDDATHTIYAKSIDAAGNSSSCSTTNVTYQVYSIAEGAAYLTGTQTINSTNLNQSTAYALAWSFSRFHSTFYSHSTSTNSQRLTVLSAGDYLVSAVVPLSGAVTRGRVAIQIMVNGTAIDYGLSQHSLITNVGGHDTSSVNITALINGLSANDYIEVTTQQVGAAGTIATPLATLYVQNVPSGRDIFSARATRTVGSTNLNSTASPFQWTSLVKDSAYTHSDSSNSHNITLNSGGNYLLFFNLPTEGSPNRTNNQRVRVLRNGSLVPGGEAKQGIMVGTGQDNRAGITWSGIISNANANDVITLDIAQEAGNNTITVTSGFRAHVYIERLPDTSDVFVGRGTTLTTNSNYNNASAQSPQFTSVDLVDTSTFSHSTSSNSHQITVLKAGDYQLTYNDSVSAGFSDGNFITRVKVNGVELAGASSATHIVTTTNSHSESSGNLSLMLRGLAANDVITIESVAEAAAGTMSASTDHLLVLRKLTKSATP